MQISCYIYIQDYADRAGLPPASLASDPYPQSQLAKNNINTNPPASRDQLRAICNFTTTATTTAITIY